MSLQRKIFYLHKNRWLNYWVLQVREFERRDFYKYSVLTTRSFATQGAYGRTWPFPKWLQDETGTQKQSHHLPERLFFVFCFLFYTACPGTVSDVHSLTNHQTQTLADTWPVTVPTQWAWGSRVINREKRALKISHFPRSVRKLNRKRWCYHSYLPMKTATFQSLA